MRLLILSFYHPPDLSACAFRVRGLIEALSERVGPSDEIEVLTTRPNRYGSFAPDAPADETVGRVTVRRLDVPGHASGMVDQARAHAAWSRQVLGAVRGRRYDAVFATSSRLMTALLGSAVGRLCGAPVYLDIRDIFVETMSDLLDGRPLGAVVPALSAAERWTIESADRVNLVSPGFRHWFEDRYPGRRFSYITNGIDSEFVRGRPPAATEESGRPLRIVYAGNFGEGQGLHAVIPRLADELGDRARFILYGDGGRRSVLEGELDARGISSVEIRDPVSRSELVRAYEEADVLFLHLNRHPAFRRVLPSKVFEYAALGKPMWAGVDGFAAHFIRTEIPNAAVFSPGDVRAGLRALATLRMGFTDRADFVERFRRERLSGELADAILDLAGGSR